MDRGARFWHRFDIRRIEDLSNAVLGAELEAIQMAGPRIRGSLAFAARDGIIFSSGQRLRAVEIAARQRRHEPRRSDGLGLLANVGLVAGQPFEPDAETRAILDAAAKTAYKMSRAIGINEEVNGQSLLVWPDRRWTNPINNAAEPRQEKSIDLSWRDKAGGFTAIERRVWMFTDYYSISPGMVSLTPGKGAFYAIAFNDANGDRLSGDASYKVTLPPDVPAGLFWSLTLYEAENASGLATEARRFPSLGSRDRPVQNTHGTTDLYIGPKALGGQEANWLATAPGRGFFAILRLYGPEEAAINYSWKPGDFEKVE
ncbi:DUF1214 domain-containing protein [Mesorhizobium sp. AaZ16]|uniref:DUF1214 domain-containing protein n=1 Tax=Mesorhizobium sp. AaZ16 TaxID=3402289 RepID=UPI00374EB388